MRYWAAIVTPERFDGERLYSHDRITLPGGSAADGPGADEPVVLVAAGPEPVVFALGRVSGVGSGLEVAYTRRLFDRPLPAGNLIGGVPAGPALVPLDPARYERIAARAGRVAGSRADWLVSVAIPVEADSPAEAVREFWTYVAELGPRELPAFVSPSGDELAMQAYVLGAETNLDPEEDD